MKTDNSFFFFAVAIDSILKDNSTYIYIYLKPSILKMNKIK